MNGVISLSTPHSALRVYTVWDFYDDGKPVYNSALAQLLENNC